MWLRSPDRGEQFFATILKHEGGLGNKVVNINTSIPGISPCFCL